MCNRTLCKEKCERLLDCKHKCIGFCGERCPLSCRIKGCKNYNESTFEVFFGNEDSEDAVFILLEDCGHAVESEALYQWIET